MRLLVPMAGLIDVAAEQSRLGKQREKTDTDLARARAKLANENFVNNAPASVVTQEKERVIAFEQQIAQLDEQLARLETLSKRNLRNRSQSRPFRDANSPAISDYWS